MVLENDQDLVVGRNESHSDSYSGNFTQGDHYTGLDAISKAVDLTQIVIPPTAVIDFAAPKHGAGRIALVTNTAIAFGKICPA